MNGVVRVNATDQHIGYHGRWGQNYTAKLALDSTSQFFFMFRGTGIKVHGGQQSLTRGAMLFSLDSNTTNIVLNDTTPGDGISPMYRADNMEDGDHQLQGFGEISAAYMEIDYFEIENSSGDPFNLLSAGTSAQNVPSRAVTVDNSSPEIIYHTSRSGWMHDFDSMSHYNNSWSFAPINGCSLSYSFDGVAIWYYSDVGPGLGFFNVSIDGSIPQRFTANNNLRLSQRLLWSNTSLGPGRHKLTLMHDDNNLNSLGLDFFRVLPDDGTSAPLLSFSTTSSGELPTNGQPAPSNDQHHINRSLLAVGLTLGLLALVVTVLGSVYYLYQRKRRTLIELDGHSVSPFTNPPMRQAGHQSSVPQDGKRPPPPAPPSNVPTATGDPAVALSGSGLGPPPSYESPIYDWRVGMAQ